MDKYLRLQDPASCPAPAGTVAVSGIGPLIVRGAEGSIRGVHGGKYRNVRGLLRTTGEVQHESTATCPDLDGLECTLQDGDLRRWIPVGSRHSPHSAPFSGRVLSPGSAAGSDWVPAGAEGGVGIAGR